MKMSVVVDRCFVINDYSTSDSTNCLYLKCGEEVKMFKCLVTLPDVVRNMCSTTMYKFWLKNEGDDNYSIVKIEEISEDNDVPEPDNSDTIEIRESLLERVNCATHLNEDKRQKLENIKSKLSIKKISIKNIEDAYNELNDCI